MQKRPLFLFGAGEHARVVIDIVERQGTHELTAIFADAPATNSLMGYRVLPIRELGACGDAEAIVAIGENWARCQAAARLQALLPRVKFAKAIHPSAQIGRDVEIGQGTVVMAGAVINSGSTILEHCILNTACVLDHGGNLAAFSSLGPRAVMGGNVTIGSHSTIALGALVIHGMTVGAHSVVGAGAVVVSPIPEEVVAFGNPCRVIRSRRRDSPVLSQRDSNA